MAHRPPVLYRYHSISDFRAEADLLQRHRLWFASPRTLNDPFECKPHFVFSHNGEMDEASALLAAYHNAPEEMKESDRVAHVRRMLENSRNPDITPAIKATFREAMQRILDATSMKSFSRNRDSILQWAYYAGAHTGYCAGFTFDALWRFTDDAGAPQNIGIGEIAYAKEYPMFDGDINFSDPANEYWFRDCLLTKSEHWSHEEEWRALRPNCKPSLQEFEPRCLREIVFGARMERRNRREMLAMLKEHPTPVEVFQARESNGRFVIEIEGFGY